MRWMTISCISGALLALGIVTACSGSDGTQNGSLFGEGASTGSDSGSSSSSNNKSSSQTSSGGGTSTTPPAPGGDAAPPAVDSAAPFNPATCECYPGQARWCDPGDGQDLGKEVCTASGTWGSCAVTTEVPNNCPTAELVGRGAGGADNIEVEQILLLCCASSDMGCEDMQDTGDQDGGTAYPGAYPYSYGKCDNIACPNTIKPINPNTGLKGQ